MFYCHITQKMSKPFDKCMKVVVEKRPKEYFGNVFNEETEEYERVLVGVGWEIVKEVNATEEGYKLWSLLSEDEKKSFWQAIK